MYSNDGRFSDDDCDNEEKILSFNESMQVNPDNLIKNLDKIKTKRYDKSSDKNSFLNTHYRDTYYMDSNINHLQEKKHKLNNDIDDLI